MRKVVREYQQMCRAEDVALLGIEARGRHYASISNEGFSSRPPRPRIIARATTYALRSAACTIEGQCYEQDPSYARNNECCGSSQ